MAPADGGEIRTIVSFKWRRVASPYILDERSAQNSSHGGGIRAVLGFARQFSDDGRVRALCVRIPAHRRNVEFLLVSNLLSGHEL